MPLLSVVTPVFNPGHYLEACLDSVAALPVEHEHIVVDGGSDDGTVAFLRERGVLWTSEPDRGQTDAVNKGLARATGRYVMWINGDDELVPEGVAAAVTHLERTADCQVVYGGIAFTDADGAVQRRHHPGRWSWRRYLILGDYVQTPTFVFRRDRALQVGPLDEHWVDAADYDFYLRLTHGVRVDRLPAVHVRFRYHESSKTARDVWRQLDEAQAIRLRWSRSPLDRAAMVGFDRLKRRALPVLTRGRWPAPF